MADCPKSKQHAAVHCTYLAAEQPAYAGALRGFNQGALHEDLVANESSNHEKYTAIGALDAKTMSRLDATAAAGYFPTMWLNGRFRRTSNCCPEITNAGDAPACRSTAYP